MASNDVFGYNYPPVDQFTEELVKETRWYTLGMFLGVPTHELDTINLNHRLEGIMRCLIEVHKYLQSTGRPLSWEKIASSLSIMDNNYLASCICNKYSQQYQQRHYSESESSNIASANEEDNSPRKSQDSSKGAASIDVPQEVKRDFLDLTQRFSALVTEIESAFRSSEVPIQCIQRFIEEECELRPLSGAEATIENVFSRLRQHYSLLCYNILGFLVRTFLSESKPLLHEFTAYTELVNRFKFSAKVIDLMSLVEKQITTGRHKIVKLKVRDFWGKATLKKFEKMVTEVLDVLYNRVSQISVGRGCICVSWVIPDIADPVSLIPPQSLEFIKAIGVVSLHIGDSVVYDIPGAGCEVMEAAMLQAIELESTRAVELLLAVDCNPEIATYNGDNAVTNIVNIRDSNNTAGAIEHVCIFGRNQNVQEILDPSSNDERETRRKMIILQENDGLRKRLQDKEAEVEELKVHSQEEERKAETRDKMYLQENDGLRKRLQDKELELTEVSLALRSTEVKVKQLEDDLGETKETEVEEVHSQGEKRKAEMRDKMYHSTLEETDELKVKEADIEVLKAIILNMEDELKKKETEAEVEAVKAVILNVEVELKKKEAEVKELNLRNLRKTPLSDQTMIGILLYLQHIDCDKKDTCQTCKLIERIAKKYGAENSLKHLRKIEKMSLSQNDLLYSILL